MFTKFIDVDTNQEVFSSETFIFYLPRIGEIVRIKYVSYVVVNVMTDILSEKHINYTIYMKKMDNYMSLESNIPRAVLFTTTSAKKEAAVS